MKEMLQSWIDTVSHHPLIEGMCQSEFYRGVIAGIIGGILFIWLIRLIFWLCRRGGKCHEIAVRNSNGVVFVSISAIGGVLKKAAENLHGLKINKIIIRRKSRGYIITLRAAMSVNEGGTAPRLINELSCMVKEQMLAVFGVDNIRDVTLMIDSCSGSADLPETASDGANGEADTGRTVLLRQEPAASENAADKKEETEKRD